MGTPPPSTSPFDLAHILERFHVDRVPMKSLCEKLRAAGGDLSSLHCIRAPVSVPPRLRAASSPAGLRRAPDPGGRGHRRAAPG